MAIEHALKAIQEEKYAIIISDSKTAISAINNIYSTNNTILNILELHEKLTPLTRVSMLAPFRNGWHRSSYRCLISPVLDELR